MSRIVAFMARRRTTWVLWMALGVAPIFFVEALVYLVIEARDWLLPRFSEDYRLAQLQ